MRLGVVGLSVQVGSLWWDRSRLTPFLNLAWMEKRHAIGLIEAMNGLLQLAKRMARGFRSYKHFEVMAYVKAAKLKPQLPLVLPT